MTSALPKVSRYNKVVKGGSTLLKRTQNQGEKGKHLIKHLVLQMIQYYQKGYGQFSINHKFMFSAYKS